MIFENLFVIVGVGVFTVGLLGMIELWDYDHCKWY